MVEHMPFIFASYTWLDPETDKSRSNFTPQSLEGGVAPQMIYVIWHDWANYHEATFTDRKKAAGYIRRVRRIGPQRLTRLTVIHT